MHTTQFGCAPKQFPGKFYFPWGRWNYAEKNLEGREVLGRHENFDFVSRSVRCVMLTIMWFTDWTTSSRNYNAPRIAPRPVPMKSLPPALPRLHSQIVALFAMALLALGGSAAASPAAPHGTTTLSAGSNELPSGDSAAMRSRLAWEREPTPRSAIVEQIVAASPPARIKVSSSFGWRRDPLNGRGRRHSGIDFPGRPGANVYATGAGRVKTAGWVAGYGNLVEIAHPNGLRTRYGHLSSILVSPGAQVGSGQVIGKIGSTGRSTGPHVHYEVRLAGVATDPRPFMRTSRVDYLVGWEPAPAATPKRSAWSDPASSELPRSVIK